jgi:hypothetical protein
MSEALRPLSNEPQRRSRGRLGSRLGLSPVEPISRLDKHVKPTGLPYPEATAASGSTR